MSKDLQDQYAPEIKVGILVTDQISERLANDGLKLAETDGVVLQVAGEAQLKGLRDLEASGVDVILARPSAVSLLSRESKLPVLPYQPNGFDVLYAVRKASRYGVPVAVVRFGGTPLPERLVEESIGIPVMDVQAPRTASGARQAVEKAISMGARSLVTGGVAAEIARQLGIPVVEPEMTAASFAEAASCARNVGIKFKELSSRRSRLESAFAELSEALMRSRRSSVPGSHTLGDGGGLTREQAMARVRDASGDPVLALEAYCLPEEALRWAREFARVEDALLIVGPPGTGKCALAYLVHSLGPASRKRFVTHRAGRAEGGAELETLLEAVGVDGTVGTLFVPAAENLSAEERSVLARFVKESRARAGLSRRAGVWLGPRPILSCEAERSDLARRAAELGEILHELRAFTLKLKPLKERRQEVSGLAETLIWECLDDTLKPKVAMLVAESSEKGLFSEAFSAILSSYTWPGNVRELVYFSRNAAVRLAMAAAATAMSSHEEIRRALEDAGAELLACGAGRRDGRQKTAKTQPPLPGEPEGEPDDTETATGGALTVKEGNLDQMVEQILLELLSRTGGNRTLVAKKLGISRTTLWKKLRSLKARTAEGEG